MYLDFPECHGTIMRMKTQQQEGGRRKGWDTHIFAVFLTGQSFHVGTALSCSVVMFRLYLPNETKELLIVSVIK